jgi:rod shape-determining protein MreC
MRKMRTFVLIVCVLFFVVVMHFVGILRPLESLLRKILRPGAAALYQLHVELDNEARTLTVDEVRKAHKNNLEVIRTLQVDQAALSLLKEENSTLRQQLQFVKSRSLRVVSADVVSKNIDPFGSSIIIDTREIEESLDGRPVITDNGILVGKVTKTEDDIAIVRLIDDHQSRIASTILEKSSSIGVVEGGHGLSVQMNLIPQHADVSIGDMVLTSGLEEFMPHGLLVGTVVAVEREPFQPFQRAIISPARSLNTISVVSIVLEF